MNSPEKVHTSKPSCVLFISSMLRKKATKKQPRSHKVPITLHKIFTWFPLTLGMSMDYTDLTMLKGRKKRE